MGIQLLAIASISLGLISRLYLVGTLPLWIDETFTYQLLARPIYSLIDGTLDPTHPPGYYLYLKFWFFLNNSVIWLRLSSILFFLISCCLLFGIGKRITSRNYAYFLVTSYALSGYAVIYDWQIRAYSGLTAVILFSIYLLVMNPTKVIIEISGASEAIKRKK